MFLVFQIYEKYIIQYIEDTKYSWKRNCVHCTQSEIKIFLLLGACRQKQNSELYNRWHLHTISAQKMSRPHTTLTLERSEILL